MPEQNQIDILQNKRRYTVWLTQLIKVVLGIEKISKYIKSKSILTFTGKV